MVSAYTAIDHLPRGLNATTSIALRLPVASVHPSSPKAHEAVRAIPSMPVFGLLRPAWGRVGGAAEGTIRAIGALPSMPVFGVSQRGRGRRYGFHLIVQPTGWVSAG